MTGNSITLDIAALDPQQVADVVALVQRYTALASAPAETVVDDESWRTASSTGWTLDHVNFLRKHLSDRGKIVQLTAFDRAIENGGFVSRDEVYKIGEYAADRKLNNWTAPINGFTDVLSEKHGLPEDAATPITTEYGPGQGFRPAIGFRVALELVKLVREG